MDGGAWWAAVHAVAKSRTRLSDFTFTFHFHALEMEMATHSSVLAWRITGMGKPGGLPSMGSNRVGHDWSDLSAVAAAWNLNREIWPWEYKMKQAKGQQSLPRECTGHGKHPFPTAQEKTLHMDITRWSIPKPDWLYSLQPKMEKLYTVSKNKTRSWLGLRSWIPYCQIQIWIEESRENH